MPTAGSVKRFRLGTHRGVAPEETWERVAPLLAPCGVTRVADVTRLDRFGIPVWQAVRPRSRNLCVSQGKGITPMAARVSAVMEALELWHAERLDHLSTTRMPLREMRYGNPIPENALRWVADTALFSRADLDWIELRSLISGERGWLPVDMAAIDFRRDDLLRPQMFLRSSNGLASGNSPEEALLHGLCELIERHALHLAHFEPVRRVVVDPQSLGTGYCRELVERLRGGGGRLAIEDLTWDVGIATFAVELVASDLPVVWRGSGSHPSRDVALSRALTEAAQSRLTFIAGARDDLPPLSSEQDPSRAFRSFAPAAPSRRFEDVPDLATARLDTDLTRVVERLASAGHEPWSVDLSHPEVGLPVHLAFAPGLMEPPLG